MKKRLLAMIMAFVMAMSLLPMSVFAVNENKDVTINKTAERIGADTWNITMTVNPKESIKPEPIELVLLMDVSLSMNDKISRTDNTHRMKAAHDAAAQLVNNLAAENVNAKVSVVTFAIQGTIELGMTDLTNKRTILNAIPTKESARYAAGTYMNHGLKAAADAFTPNTSAKKVIVMLSDGKPQSSWGDTTNPSPSAEQIKGLKEAGITVHTVAFTMGIDVLESISTGTGGQYFIANNMEELTRAFTEIKKLISAMVYDPLGEKVSIVGSASAPGYNDPTVNNGVMQWSPAKGELTSNDQVTITYKVRVDPKKLAVGENENVPLNGQATLNYVVQQNGTASENRHLNFPIPTDDIEVGQLTTKVMLDGKELTAEQVVGDKIIVYENNQFTWKLPAADATKIINGVTYTYSHSEYDSKETAATSAPVTVGAHTLVHYYNSTPKYGVTYEIGFAKNTPTENRPTMTVTDDAKYAVGETVPVQSVPQSVEDTQNNGVWTFDGWYLDDQKAPDSVLMKKDGLRFTGTWNFEKNQPAVTVKKELAGKWNGTSIAPADTYSPGDRVVYKITATVNADNVKSFTIEDVVGENLKDGTFIVEKGVLDSGKVWLNDELKDLTVGKYYSKKDAESATDTRETYHFSTNSVTLTRQIAKKFFNTNTYTFVGAENTEFSIGDTITVYYFATVENVDGANQTFYNTANVTANGDTHTSTTDPTTITLKPYHVTFLDKDGNVIEGYDKTEYPYGETIGDKVPADPEVADGTDGLLQRFDGWYETTSGEVLNTETAYNDDVVFRAKVTDVMKVEKALTTDSSGLKVGDEVSYTITATVYDASLTSITVTEEPGPGLIGGTLTCDNAGLGIVSLGGVRTATVAIDGNTAVVTPVKVLGSGGFKSGDTITFTYTATLGIADTILTDNGTRNTVTLTNNNEGETATDTTCPVENVGLPTIDVNVAKTVKEINGKEYKDGDTVSKGDTVTYEITVTNDGSVPVFGVPVIEKPNETLTNGHFVPEEGTITIADLTKIDLSDISALIRNLMSGKSTLNVALGSNANLVLTADWSKVNPKELLEALTTIRNIKDLDSLLSALDVLLTKPDVTAGSIEEAIGNIENYMAALLQKYGFLNGTLYVDGKCADVAILGRIDKDASATLTYTATVNDCDENGKVINTVCVGGDKATAEIDAQTYTVTYTDGVTDEEVFPDQVYTVISGAKTPDFVGTPARDGYAFTGWNPDPKTVPTVTEDATYTATWTDEIIPVLFYISGLDTEGYTVENPVPSIPNLSVKDGYVYLNAMFTATQGNAETLEIKGNDEVAQWLEKAISGFDSDAAYTLNDLIDAANVHDANLDADDFFGWVYQSVHWEGNEGWHVHIALTKPTTPIEPEAAAYKVEHYKWNPETVTYDLVAADTEMKSAKLNTEVTAVAKTYEGYALNPQAAGFKQSGIVTMPKAGDDGIIDMLVLKLYYDIDTKGDSTDPENKGDDIPDKYQKKVTFKVVNGAWNDETTADVIKYVTLTNGEGKWAVDGGTYTVTAADVTAIPAVGEKPNSGYKAGSWDALYKAGDNITGDVTYTYTYAKKSSNSNGGSSNHKPALNKEDHYAYIVGYPDGTVQPGGNITRAEVATIFFRMLTDDSRNEFWSQTNDYSDVSEGQWFNNAISTLANAGILSGYPDGTFRPNAPITRAEFTKIAASFFEHIDYTIENPFVDVDSDDWFYEFVMAAYEAGLITGYPEGDFRPNANISRAESVTIVNRTLGRAPDADHFLDDMIVWPDNAEDAWYYEAVQEATNSHEYVMKGSGDNKYENWTKILEVRDWPALEKEWSDANSAAGGEVVK